MVGDFGSGLSWILGLGAFAGLRYLYDRWRPGPVRPLPTVVMGLISLAVVLGTFALYQIWLNSAGVWAAPH